MVGRWFISFWDKRPIFRADLAVSFGGPCPVQASIIWNEAFSSPERTPNGWTCCASLVPTSPHLWWGFVSKKKAVSQRPRLFQSTPLKFNIAPKNRQSQKETDLPTIIFQGRAVKFRGCTSKKFSAFHEFSAQVGILAPKEKLQGIDIEPDPLTALVVRVQGEGGRWTLEVLDEGDEGGG